MDEGRIGILMNVVQHVCHQGETWYKNQSANRTVHNIREKVATTYASRHSLTELRSKLTQLKKGCDLEDKYVFLKPIEDRTSVVPIMTFKFEAQGELTALSLRSALFSVNDAGALVAVGYRFDSPSIRPVQSAKGKASKAVPQQSDKHAFFHAQPIKALSLSNNLVLPHSCWTPEQQPSFPLDAKDSLTLFVSFLIGLYGASYLSELFSADFGPKLKDHIKAMHICQFMSS